ncbi:MAG: hypothetical protein ACRECH_14640, partial [Nitrososphaerales archaeon]
MSGYRRQIILTASIGIIIALGLGLGVYYAQPQLGGSSSTTIQSTTTPGSFVTTTSSSTSSYSTSGYSAPIIYQPPASEDVKDAVGTCGIYAILDSPLGNDVPIGTTVVANFYGIFNGTSSCLVPRYLEISITLSNQSSPIQYATTRLLFVPAVGNSSVYGASLTFTSFYASNNTITPTQLPSGYHSQFGQISVVFNMGAVSTNSSRTTYANE